MSWVLMVAAGFACTWVMTRTSSHLLDMILVRIAAACWIAAGMIGAAGWLGPGCARSSTG